METNKDYIEEMQACLAVYHKTEQSLITTNDRLHYAGRDGDSGSYIWLRDPLSDVHLETVATECLANPELHPIDFLADVLRQGLKTIIPTGIFLTGLGIDRVENSFRFCISGSTSLEEIQKLFARHQVAHGHADET